MRRKRTALFVLGMTLSACGPKTFSRPADAGVPAPEAAAIWHTATAECRKVQSDAPAMDLVGGRINLRGLVTARNEIRLEADYHGGGLFTLAGTGARAVLLLNGETGYEFVDEAAGEIVNALIGLPLDPATLLPILTGCVTTEATASRTLRHGKLLAMHTTSAVVYLGERDGAWRVVGGDVSSLRVDYPAFAGAWPREVVIAAPSSATRPVKLRIHSHLIDPAPIAGQFDLSPPAGARRITLDELRARWQKD
jgi:hypothetical protein